MAIQFDELFAAALGMFNLDSNNASSLQAGQIQAVFNQVLQAEDLCYKEYVNRPQKHEPEGLTEV